MTSKLDIYNALLSTWARGRDVLTWSLLEEPDGTWTLRPVCAGPEGRGDVISPVANPEPGAGVRDAG